MITRKSLAAFALATTCLVPLAAFAADPASSAGGTLINGDITIGVMGVGGTNPDQAGRYSGLNTGGFNLYGAFDLRGGDAWNSGGTRYYELIGNNLVFQTGDYLGSGVGHSSNWTSSINNELANEGSLGLKVGDQGTWGLAVNFDSITYTGNVIDSIYTVNGGIASLNKGLVPWGGATTTAAGPVTAFTAASLAATGGMQPVQTGVRRDIISVDGKYLWNGWTISGAFRHEHKEGSVEESFDGIYGGTAFTLPVNYDTDRYDAMGQYVTHQYQAQLQYTYSHFVDNYSFVNLPFPTSNTAVPYQRSSAYATPPSSDAHYLTVMLGTGALIPKTQLNLNARVGLEKQNDTFPPNTADPSLAGVTGLSSLDALMQGTTDPALNATATVYQLKATATSRPLPNVDTHLYYGLDGRDVKLDQYKVFGSGQGSDSSISGTQYVVPQEWLKENAGFDVGYRILPESDTKLTVGYRYDSVDRSNAQVGHSSTNTATAGLSSDITSQIDGKVSFTYADRTGAMNYLTPWANIAGAQSGQTYSGAYYQAPMTSEAVKVRADYTPMTNLSTGLYLEFKNEDYHYGAATPVGTATLATIPLTGVGEGIKQDYVLSVGPDVSYRPMKNVNLHAFYNYELLFYNNTGNGACGDAATAATAACAGTAGYFQNKQTSSNHTIGLSADWQVNDKLKLKGDYTLSVGTVMFGEYNGVFVNSPTAAYQNVVNYPDINSIMHNFRLTATYELTPSVELGLQGIYTAYRNNDWNDTSNAIQQAGAASVSILTPGYASPNYSVIAVLAGVKFKL